MSFLEAEFANIYKRLGLEYAFFFDASVFGRVQNDADLSAYITARKSGRATQTREHLEVNTIHPWLAFRHFLEPQLAVVAKQCYTIPVQGKLYS